MFALLKFVSTNHIECFDKYKIYLRMQGINYS